MKNLSCLHHFLGLEVNRTPDGFFSSQTKYAKDLLVRTPMLDAKPIGSPPSYKAATQPDHSTLKADQSLYQSIAGALQYLTLTRPDLAVAVNQVCQHMHQPSVTRFATLKRVLQYLKGTLTYGVHFKRGKLQVIAYSNADCARDPVNCQSTSRFCVSW